MRAGRVLRAGLLTLAALLLQAAPSPAHWTVGASASSAARAQTMPTGNQPTATVASRDVTVTWAQSAFGSGATVSGYVVKRYSTGGQLQTIAGGCAGTLATVTCTEVSVPPGTWRYTVTPTHGAWSGSESAQSAAATVTAPTLALGSTTVTALPATLTGTIAGFTPGQTVTLRLDDVVTGRVLSGSISPTTVPAGGGASVTVTVPAGTVNGSHTIYAIGSGGDQAAIAIAVAIPAFVGTVGEASCGATSMTIIVPAAGVAANDTVILRLALRGTTTGAVAASDSQRNAYANDQDVFTSNQRLVVFRARATTALAAGNTITVTYPSASSAGVVADALAGIAASAVDVAAQATGNTVSPSVRATTTNARDLVIGAVSMAGLQTPIQPTGWTGLTSQRLTCGSNSLSNVGGYRIASATASFTYNPSVTTSGRWSAALVGYKAG
jgi:hypothetical protein